MRTLSSFLSQLVVSSTPSDFILGRLQEVSNLLSEFNLLFPLTHYGFFTIFSLRRWSYAG